MIYYFWLFCTLVYSTLRAFKIFGKISGKPNLFCPFDTRRNKAEHNSSHLMSFPVKTRDSNLIKVSKTLIFKYFANFLVISGQILGRSGPFWSSNITKNEAKHYNNHLKWFPGETSKSILIKGSKTLIFAYFAYFLALFGPFWPFWGVKSPEFKMYGISFMIAHNLAKNQPKQKNGWAKNK